MSLTFPHPVQANAPRPAGMGVAAALAPRSLTANDIGTIADFYNNHLADNASADSRRQDRIADNATALVGEALDIVGNDMPEDIRCALNVVMAAAPVLDAVPKPGADLQRYMAGLKAIEDLLDRGANSIAGGGRTPTEAAFRRKLSGLLRELKTEVANLHRHRANQLPPPCRVVPKGFAQDMTGLIAEGLRLLKLTPSTAESAQVLKERLGSIHARIEPLLAAPDDIPLGMEALDDDESFSSKRNALVGALRSVCKDVETRIDILERNIALNPLSRKTAFEAKAYSTAAAIGVIDRILVDDDHAQEERKLSSERRKALEAALSVLDSRREVMGWQTDCTTLTKHEIQAIMGGKGKYAYRSTAEMEKVAPEIAASIDALVDSIVSPVRDGSDADDPLLLDSSLPRDEWSDDERAPLLAAHGRDSLPDGQIALPDLAPSGLPLSSPSAREEHIMTTFLDKLFTKLDIDPGRKLEGLYRKTKIDMRDCGNWANISRQVQLVHGDRVRSLTSELTPQAGLRFNTGNRAPVFPALVDEWTGAQDGVNCHQSAHYRHPTNLAQTRLLDESGKELFNATRHGTLSAYDISPNALRDMDDTELSAVVTHLFPDRAAIEMALPAIFATPEAEHGAIALARLQVAADPLSDEELRTVMDRIRTDGNVRSVCAERLKKAAAVTRAREIALAALACHPEKLRAAEAGRGDVSISINTISLLTPDTARGIYGWFRNLKGDSTGGADELAMVRDQYEAWEHIRKHGIEVEGPNGQKTHVKVEVNDFNFGVNDIEFLFGSSERSEVRERNTRAMQAVIGDLATDPKAAIGGQVGEWLKAHPYARTVETLAHQVADIWHSRAYGSAGVEPYKLVTRLAVLTHMIGAHPDFNCKSGKDRTGELDIEAKYLAEMIDATGEVPEPDAERDGEQRGNFYRLAMEGGNIELQKLNTGVPGYKLKAKARLHKFLGHFEGGRELMTAITLDRTGNGKGDLRGESIRAFQGLASFEGS